ncbi:MAG TPA: hypothetical protein GX503_01600 [Clostridiales bacterium]|nr:hypothetical protein [Clostridiales bacterium]
MFLIKHPPRTTAEAGCTRPKQGFTESASGSNKRFEKSNSSKFLKILPLPIGHPVQRQLKQRPAVFTDF